MKKKIKGTPIIKKDDSIAFKVEPADIETFINLAAAVGSVDQIIEKSSGKLPQRDLVVIIGERKKAATELEKFVAGVYKKYDLDDSYSYAFDVIKGEVFQLPTKRLLWRFK